MAGSNKEKAWIAGGTAVAVLIAVASWFLLISPQFADQADSEQQVADAQTQNIVLQQRLNTLREQAGHADELNAELGQLRAAVPAQHDLEGFTRQLTDFATAAGVTIESISPTTPTQVARPQPPASTTAEGDAASTTDSAPATTAPATPEGPAGNLYSVSVTVVTTGPMAAQRAFLAALEKQGERRSLVTSADFTPVTDTPQPTAPAGETGPSGAEPTDAGPTAEEVPPPPSDTQGSWLLTSELLIFVAPQSAGDEAALAAGSPGNS